MKKNSYQQVRVHFFSKHTHTQTYTISAALFLICLCLLVPFSWFCSFDPAMTFGRWPCKQFRLFTFPINIFIFQLLLLFISNIHFVSYAGVFVHVCQCLRCTHLSYVHAIVVDRLSGVDMSAHCEEARTFLLLP